MRIIMTVGTSLLANFKANGGNLYSLETDRANRSAEIKECEELLKELEEYKLSKKLIEFIEDEGDDSCAEVKSVRKIKEKYGSVYDIHMLISDTCESRFVARVLKEFFDSEYDLDSKIETVKNFNVSINDRSVIKQGYKNMIKTVHKISSGYGEIYNISGGYKAFIPVMVLLSSYKKVPLVYIYETSDFLIEIPPLPFKFNTEVVEKLQLVFEEIEREGFISIEDRIYKDIINRLSEQDKSIIEYFFEEDGDGYMTISTVGEIVWEDLKARKEVKLVKSNLRPEEKPINPGKHHGNHRVEKFAEKLIRSPYVEGIINSAEYKPWNKKFIQEIEPNGNTGVLKIKIPNGEKECILVKTTGRNKKETEKIAEILEREFGGG